jgi:ABC-type dipeptide/oligopeptide/nickel transport system permease component
LDDVLQRPFTRFYRGKGASFLQLLWHTKRNWLYPLLAVFLFFFPFALAESVIFEFLFGFQGLGKLLWYASDFDTNLEAVRIFTPKLMALTGVFVLISQISRWIHLVMMKEEL